MKLSCAHSSFDYDFTPVELAFEGKPYWDIFGQKNNKTVAETLEHPKYAKLKGEVVQRYSKSLSRPLGTFLFELKYEGDAFYRRFLNKYGDLKYSVFVIKDPKYFESKGVYAYLAGDELKYIGRCIDSMKKRVNQGYGKIHPKNCYLDGQVTNCHLNSRITETNENITLWLCRMESPSEIKAAERALIRAWDPRWNIQH